MDKANKVIAEAQVLCENLSSANGFILAVALDGEIRLLSGGPMEMQALLKLAIESELLKKVGGHRATEG